jgi:HPt (histidine-containing phosphotransfer) domain-containing protein
MPAQWIWVCIILLLGSGKLLRAEAPLPQLPLTWQISENESGPQDWQFYQKTAVPFGINKIVWLKQTLPEITNHDLGLYFANGLEGLEVYIDDALVYQYGEFTKAWTSGNHQRWHFIPLTPEHSGKELRFRTHYMISYMTRTLFPVIERNTDLYAKQWHSSIVFTMVSGAFGVLAVICLTIAAQRRRLDIFFQFGIMNLCAMSWTMFNQDSLVKQFTGIPIWAWIHLDLGSLYIAVPALFTFFSSVLKDESRLVVATNKCLWGLAAAAGLVHATNLINPWYLLPLLHIIALPALLTIVPRMVISSFRKNQEARFLILGSAAVSLSGMHDWARYVIHSPLVQMIPVGVSIMFGSMVAVLAHRYRSEQSQTIATQAKLLDDIQSLNSKLQEHVQEVEAIVEEKTMEIRSILGHIQQGIFMVEGRDLRLNREYSAYLEQLIGETQIGGRSFRASFLDKCQLGADQKQTLLSILELVLGESEAAFDLNAANLPQEASIQSGTSSRILELSWAPILDETGIIQKILVTARDVTRLRELQTAAQRSQEEMQLVQIILVKKPERFARFLKSTQTLLEQVEPTVAQIENAAPHENRFIFRNLHTLKGNARTFGLDQLAELAHEAEQTLVSRNWESLRAALWSMHEVLNQYNFVLQQRMGWSREADHIMLDRRQLEQHFLQAGKTSALEEMLLPQTFSSARHVINEAFAGVQRIAEDLGKEKPSLNLVADGVYFPRSTEEALAHCLGHLFRNALDHGLEKASERQALGKKPFGCITVEMHVQNGWLLIRCSDDGRGLDVGSIRSRALARGLIQPQEILNEARVEELIFSSGFSTKRQTNLVSGRGVGLDAVRGFLHELQGEIRLVVRSKDTGSQFWTFAFELSLPAGCWLERHSPMTAQAAAS